MHVNLGNNKEKLNEAHFPLSHPPSASNTIGYAHITRREYWAAIARTACQCPPQIYVNCALQCARDVLVPLVNSSFADMNFQAHYQWLFSSHVPVIRTQIFHKTFLQTETQSFFFIFLRNCPQQQRRGLVGRANRECSAGTRWISTLHCIRYTALH